MLLTTFHSVDLERFEWLRHTGVITARLKAQCSNVNMQVLRHEWGACNWWERFVLGGNDDSLIRREIVMFGDEVPRWFARTMIPKNTYAHDPAFFDRLTSEPLGNLIFQEPRITRTMHSYGIDKKNIEYHWLEPAWRGQKTCFSMRLSTLVLDEVVRFYLAEIFL